MDLDERVRRLRSLALFASLSDERLRAAAALLESRVVEDGKAFIVEGETGGGLYYIVSGRVRIAKSLGEGGEKDLAFLGPGEALGEMDMLREGTRSASAYAVGPVELLGLKTAAFKEWLAPNPATAALFYAGLAEVQAGRLRRTSDEVAMLYDLSQLLVTPQATAAGLLTHALKRVTPHLQGRWSAEARLFNFFDDELNLVARLGDAQTPDSSQPAPKAPKETEWTDGRTLRLSLQSPKSLLAALSFRAAGELNDAARHEAERTLGAVSRLLASALENVEHRTDEALRERLRSQADGPRI
jgi:CRP-like cAMP-binding protein